MASRTAWFRSSAVNGLSSTRTGVSDDSICGTASGSADVQRTATLGRYPSQRFGDLTPIDLWHREVGQDQIERLGTRLNESQRGVAVLRVFNVKAFTFERAAEELTHHRFVVDHQHGGPVPDGTVGSGEGCIHAAPAGSRAPCKIS